MRPAALKGEMAPPIPDDEEDGDGKKKGGGSSKDRPGSVSGRKQRQEERNKRAAERKGRSQEMEVQLARGVTDLDVLERPRSGSLKHKLKKKKPTEQRKGRVPVVLPITVRSLSEAIGIARCRRAVQVRADARPGHADHEHQHHARPRIGDLFRPGKRL